MKAEWIRDYRAEHPAAARWARGSTAVRHTAETQDRIFRMAEQMRQQRAWSWLGGLFTVLHALDEVVDSETWANARPEPNSAAAAAVVGYKILFGRLPSLKHHGWPAAIDPVKMGDSETARSGLQAQGFDTIVIDGMDPAAYLWALFEMDQRRLASAEANRRLRAVTGLPRCLALIPAETAAEPHPAPVPPRALVGVGG